MPRGLHRRAMTRKYCSLVDLPAHCEPEPVCKQVADMQDEDAEPAGTASAPTITPFANADGIIVSTAAPALYL